MPSTLTGCRQGCVLEITRFRSVGFDCTGSRDGHVPHPLHTKNRIFWKGVPRHMDEVPEPSLCPTKARKFRWRHICRTVSKVQIDKFIQMLVKLAGKGINVCCYRFMEHFQEQLLRERFIVMERSTKSVCVGFDRTF